MTRSDPKKGAPPVGKTDGATNSKHFNAKGPDMNHSTTNGAARPVDPEIEAAMTDALQGFGRKDGFDPSVYKLSTAGELLKKTFTDPVWVLPGMIPAGVSFLAGRPKLGKSWLALQVAVAAATGGMALDERLDQRRVLYLALEDSERRLQDRLRKLHCPADTDDLLYLTGFDPITRGGAGRLIDLLRAKEIGFCVVDTWARWAPSGGQLDDLAIQTGLAELQHFAVESNLAVLLIDHHRKGGLTSTQDLVDDVMGSTAKTGIADATLGLYRQRGQSSAELRVTGRDLEEKSWALEFHKSLFTWTVVGDADGVRAGTLRAAILETLQEHFTGKQASCSKIAMMINKDRSNVGKELNELVAAGRLVRLPDKVGQEVIYKVVGG